VSSGNPDVTPGESITDLQFTFSVGATPQLTGYVDEDAELPTADGVVSGNATSTTFADDPGSSGLAPQSIATTPTGFAAGSEQIAALTFANGNGTAQWAYQNIRKSPQAGFSTNLDCSDFASQALHYGGGERELSDLWDFYRNHGNKSLWWYVAPAFHGLVAPSYTWGDSRYLAAFLYNKGSAFIHYAIDARPGDLIFANWNGLNGFGGIDHVGVVHKVDRFGEIYITQHSPAETTLPLSTWEQTNSSGSPTPGHWNPNLILWIIRPKAW
jgi:cell wall-associated NlpC family hydrolase